MPFYYPFFTIFKPGPVEAEFQGGDTGTVNDHTYIFAIQTDAKPDATWPPLTVNGKVGLGDKALSGIGTYDLNAPDLAVSGKAGIGYNFANHTKSYDYANAPALSVAGKAIIGPDLRLNPGYSAATAATLSVNGSVAIGEGQSYVPGSGERLTVDGNTAVGGDLTIGGSTVIKLRLTVGHDSRFSRCVYISDPKIQKRQTGVFINTTAEAGTHGSEPDRPDATYPVFAVINGLMGHVQHDEDLGSLGAIAPDQVINQAINSTGFTGHYILMGDLKGLLKASVPTLPAPYNDAYGMRMSWNSDFLMLKLVDIDERPSKKKTIVKGKKTKTFLTKYFPARRDAVLAWGDKRENYFRIRYIGEEIDIFHKDAANAPVAPGKMPVTDKKKTALAKRRQLAYNKAKRMLLRALADRYGQKIDQATWPGYRDIVVVDPDGSVVVNGAIYAMGTRKTSDARLKEAVEPIASARDLALALRGVKFAWKDGAGDSSKPEDEPREYGMIAQEVEKLCPEAVSRDSDGILAIDYDQIVPILLEAIKEQEHVISSQHSRLAKLEKAVEQLARSSPTERTGLTARTGEETPAPARPPSRDWLRLVLVELGADLGNEPDGEALQRR